jgi:hypothetical protein
MSRLWVIIAALSSVMAVVLIFQLNYEAAFVVAAVGVVAWFLNYRVQVKKRLNEYDLEDEPVDEEFEANEKHSAEDSRF